MFSVTLPTQLRSKTPGASENQVEFTAQKASCLLYLETIFRSKLYFRHVK